MGFEGGEACQKIWLQRRGQGKNISGEGGGGSPPQKNSFKFCSDDICDNRELNNGIEDVTQKVNSPASKFIERSYCNSFNSLSNVGVKFLRTVSKFTKRQRKSLPCVPVLLKT